MGDSCDGVNNLGRQGRSGIIVIDETYPQSAEKSLFLSEKQICRTVSK